MHARVLTFLVLASSYLAACTSSTHSGSSETAVTTGSQLGPYQTSVVDALRAARQREGRTWFTTSATLAPDWVLPTPALDLVMGRKYEAWPHADDCAASDGRCDPTFGVLTCNDASGCTRGTCTTTHAGGPQGLCLGAADARWDTIYDIITGAEKYVDIAFLLAPSGRFLTAMGRAIASLNEQHRTVTVRLLYSHVMLTSIGDTKASDVLANLVAQGLPQDPTAASVSVHVARADGIRRWNHSKFVAADESDVMLGGAEASAENYLAEDPVFDFTMRAGGDLARVTHVHADHLWDGACTDSTDTYAFYGSAKCPPPYGDGGAASSGQPVIAVANDWDNVGSDPAIAALMDAATKTLKLTQQDLYAPVGSKFDMQVLSALARGVEVYLVKSGRDESLFVDPNAWAQYSALQTADKLFRVSQGNWRATGFPDAATAADRVCNHFHVAHLHYSTEEDKYPDGKFINYHAKNVLADDAAVYIGSANMYSTTPTTLAEFGIILEDRGDGTIQPYRDYWDRVWEGSKSFEVTGSHCTK